MKKTLLLIIVGIVVIIILAFVFIGVVNKKDTNETPNEIKESTETPSEMEGATEIILNQETDINPLKNIKIAGTNDYFSITDDLKDSIPSDNGETSSFSFKIPYKFIVDGSEFQGSYTLSSQPNSPSTEDDNPKYNVEITNFSAVSGIFVVLISEK